jgi:hypothetical protein
MSKQKKIHVQFSVWDQHWHGEVWAKNVGHARHNFLQEVLKGPDEKNRLQVRVRDGNKEIVFFDRVFRVDNNLWPDDMDEFYTWACEALKKNLTAKLYRKPIEA